MAKANTEYVDDAVLQMMACNLRPFSKTNIIEWGSTVLHTRLKSSQSFLTRYEGKVIESIKANKNNVERYYLKPEAWMEVLKNIPQRFFNRWLGAIEDRGGWRIQNGEDMSTRNDFTESFYNFLHGQPFEPQAFKVGWPKWAAAAFMTERNAMNTMWGVYFYQFIDRLADMPENAPYIKATSEKLKDFLFYLRKVRILYLLPVNEELIQDTLTVPGKVLTEKNVERDAFVNLYLRFLRDGNLKAALHSVIGSSESVNVLQMIEAVQAKNYSLAVSIFQRMVRGTREYFLPENPLGNFYYAVALYLDKSAAAMKKTETILRSKEIYYGYLAAEKIILTAKLGQSALDNCVIGKVDSAPLENVLYYFALKHFHLVKSDDLLEEVNFLVKMQLDKGLNLLKLEMSEDFDFLKDEQAALEKATGMHPSLPYIKVLPPWENVLNQLLEEEGIGQGKGSGKKVTVSTERISYLLNRNCLYVRPRLQKSRDGVTWSSGRNIAMAKFRDGGDLPYTQQDRAVASLVVEYNSGWYGNTSYELEGGAVINALAGHPFVFDEKDPASRIDIVREKLQLSVTHNKQGYTVKSNVPLKDMDSSGYAVYEETPQLIKVVKITDKQQLSLKLLNTIGTFPPEAKDKLTKVLEAFSHNMVVMGDLLQNTNIKTVEPDSRIIFRLQPSEDEINLQLLVRPFTKCPPYMRPTEGMEMVSTTYKGESLQTHRDMKAEDENLKKASLLLKPFADEQEGDHWALSIEECLSLLDTLREHPDDGIVEWPEGARFTVRRGKLVPGAMHLAVNSMASWFDISGNIEIGDGEKMKIAELMDKVRQAKGNFIQLGDNEYVAVSEQLRKQLATLDKMSQQQRGHLRIATYNAPALDDMEAAGIDLEADQHYRDFIQRVEESGNLKVRVPRNINAELRDYQKEGYVWMSRLAYWGAGALLADDMGLGKTLQTITVLLGRAKQGAALVVVPTSLILNWRDELGRFAPGLNVKILNQAGDNRSDMIKEAAAFDVVITTYGLLINEEESLCGREWNTIVLDEAHTIKNRDTKMSKAAMKLKGNFRILLTGTPVQNNLSEIWNLMQFANPNLLGSFQQFSDRFIAPIEKLHDKATQRVLRRVISPFILRRTKNDVLNELPEKTEVTRKVQLSPEEWALYDNIRQKALINLADGEATPLQTLTELTRLRQAACNAQLIDKKLRIPSSKEAVFLEMVDSLHDNHHRALVFSQFTSHLALIRKALDKRGIEYLYLDGATPAKERDKLVREFQTGDMPLFLISLKAGGLGLNLTAADYVIHLDPWWNPAIEEQASDRAYRIGQQNPVTVYRLITEGTIEEKIIQLHQSKKSLADALLEGGDLSAKLSKDELLQLLRENSVNA